MAMASLLPNGHRPSIGTASPAQSATPLRFTVLVPEKVSQDGLALLQGDFEVHERKGLSSDELAQIIGNYDALIVRSETKVTKELLEKGRRLKVVARAGVGVDNVGMLHGSCSVLSFSWQSTALRDQQKTLETEH